MPTPPKLVRVKLADGTETTVGASLAESHDLKVIDKPAVSRGRVVRTKYPVTLKGDALADALEAAGLDKSGTAAQKRKRLADHQMSAAPSVGDAVPTNPGGESATSKEDSK